MKKKYLIIFLAIFLILGTSIASNVFQKDNSTFNLEDADDVEKMVVKIVTECSEKFSYTENNLRCFNEQIDFIISQNPNVESKLKSLGVVFENNNIQSFSEDPR